jgi:phosphate transport system substrate-binding protein
LLILPVFSTAADPFTVSGCSVSNVAYLTDLAKAYEKETGQKVLVRGGGSIVGLSDLGADRVDLAASCLSKIPNPREELSFVPVAWDALVFIANKSNPISSITPQQVKEIYDGKITNWKQLGGADLKLISYIAPPKDSGGIGEALEKYILGTRPQQQSNSSMQSSSAAIWEQLVERNPEGFASTGFGSARKRDLKMLKVNGVAPTRETIVSGKYPYKRYLYLVMTRDAKPEVKKFVDYALSKKGQAHISSYGMPPLAEIR